MNHRSSTFNDIVSNEVKFKNCGNLYHQLTPTNIDDLYFDVLIRLTKIVEDQKDHIDQLATKMDFIMHVLTDTSKIRNVVKKFEGRIYFLDRIFVQLQEL